jgi:hypothetical protein
MSTQPATDLSAIFRGTNRRARRHSRATARTSTVSPMGRHMWHYYARMHARCTRRGLLRLRRTALDLVPSYSASGPAHSRSRSQQPASHTHRRPVPRPGNGNGCPGRLGPAGAAAAAPADRRTAAAPRRLAVHAAPPAPAFAALSLLLRCCLRVRACISRVCAASMAYEYSRSTVAAAGLLERPEKQASRGHAPRQAGSSRRSYY